MRLAATLVLASASALVSSSSSSAALTTHDTQYDGYAVLFKSSLAMIGEVVAGQNKQELAAMFNATNTKLQTAIDDGSITIPEYLNQLKDFYKQANETNPGFGDSASDQLENNGVLFQQYVAAAPAAWCDYLLDTLEEASKNSTEPTVATSTSRLRRQIEELITFRSSADDINDFLLDFYVDTNKRDPNFLKAVDTKIAALGERFALEASGKTPAADEEEEPVAEVSAISKSENATESTTQQSGSAKSAAVSSVVTAFVGVIAIGLSVFM